MIRIAILSFWHVHAKDYALQAEECADAEIVAVWDEIAERGQAEAQARNVRHFLSLDELLADPIVDGVIVNAPTSSHCEVMLKAASAGKHIFTEKVLAPTLAECREIAAAVRRTGVKLVVSLPRLNAPYTAAIRDILERGLLGCLTQARIRVAHDGAVANWLPPHFYNKQQSGGGALIDLGCHPMYLARLFLGMPERVSAQFGFMTGKETEDNAAVLLAYPDGAIGIVETGYVNAHSPFSIELHGTEGSIMYGFHHGQLLMRANKPGEGKAERWEARPLPDKLPSAFQQWVGHIRHNTAAEENVALAVDLTALMEAANLSASRQRAVSLSEIS